MKILQSATGFKIFVDDEDFEWASKVSWSCGVRNGIVTSVHHASHGKKTVMLAHEILRRRGIPVPNQVDHADRNNLNNVFENLRLATVSQNCMNQGLGLNNTSGYKGVSFQKAFGKFIARITVRGVVIHLGRYIDPVKAAKAYDAAARKYHKQFAFLNFPEGA